jgi:hypothetical protein
VKAGKATTAGWRKNWKDQIGDQKLKGMNQSERQFAMFGRDEQAHSEPNANAASQITYLRLAPNHWALATMQHPRGGKIMTSKRRKPLNQRSCFLFRIERMEAVGMYGNHLFRTTLSAPS